MPRKAKRVLVLSDFHCGHEVGLTPPKWNVGVAGDPMIEYRSQLWKNFEDTLKAAGKPDVLVVNGDLIDGRGERSGSLELLVLDRRIQAQMAADIISEVDAKSVTITRGTDYHTGKEEDWEDVIAGQIGDVNIGDVRNLDVNGLIMNFRHHIGGSQTPLGRASPLVREEVWNALWSLRGGFPLADVIVRSHVHYHSFTGGPGWLAITTPALQGYGTRYGERRLSGLIDWGAVVFDITSKEDYTWKALTYQFQHPEPVHA